jgi:hypothetical protein
MVSSTSFLAFSKSVSKTGLAGCWDVGWDVRLSSIG